MLPDILISPAEFMWCVIDRMHYALQVVFCFRHFTASHYHHNARLNTYKCLWALSCGGVSNMLLVLSTTFHCHFNIWSCMCSTDPFQFRWLKAYIYRSIMLLSSSNLKYQHYPLLSHFPWLCASDACYITFCHLLHMHSGKTRVLFSLLLCSLWWVQIVGYALACRSY